MAFLRRKQSGDAPPLHLRAYQLVGRWDGSHLVIDRAGVSKHHATIQWMGTRWMLRDLGSRNGTLHNGARVDPAQPQSLRPGDEIAFGERDEVWIVGDVEPPGLLLVPTPASASHTIHVGTAEAFRALPSRDDPQVTIVRRGDGSWCAELASGETVDLYDGGVVTLVDHRYEVALPDPEEETAEPVAPLVELDSARVRFELAVAADEESAALTVFFETWDRPRRVKECVPLYLLACLVRQRREDWGMSEDAPIAEPVSVRRRPTPADGWMEIEAACKALDLTREQLGVQVFRVRESLRELGLPQAGTVIERRKGWIRTGIDPRRIRVVRDGPYAAKEQEAGAS